MLNNVFRINRDNERKESVSRKETECGNRVFLEVVSKYFLLTTYSIQTAVYRQHTVYILQLKGPPKHVIIVLFRPRHQI